MSNSLYIRNVFAAAYAAEAAEVSFHYDDPGTDGSNEYLGLARQPLVWTGPVDGTVTAATVSQTFSATDYIVGLGFWNASGDFISSAPYAVTYPNDATDTFDISYSHPE